MIGVWFDLTDAPDVWTLLRTEQRERLRHQRLGRLREDTVIMDGAVKRTVTHSGVLIQSATGNVIGQGYYLLNPSSGTKKTTEYVQFTR